MLNLGAFDRIQFDQYTGEVLKFDRFEDKPIDTKIISLFPQLHYGDIFGLPTKIFISSPASSQQLYPSPAF
jgi:uncharacterized iron-regulated membrane protein